MARVSPRVTAGAASVLPARTVASGGKRDERPRGPGKRSEAGASAQRFGDGAHAEKMPGTVARRLYEARDAGKSRAEQERILAEALRDEYFKAGGTRADSLDEVELNDIAWMDLGPGL